MTFENVVKTTVFLKNMADFAQMNETYAKYFHTNPPARSTVEVARLPRDVQVESAPLEELDADLMQMTIPAGSRLHGVYLPELRLPEDAAVVLIVRGWRSFVPDETTRLMRGDQALLVSARRSRAAAERRLRAVSRAGRLANWRGETGAATGAD